MAINNKPTVPAPAIFSSDPLEQIAMRGMGDPKTSGLHYMFLNAFGDRRKMDQAAYLAGVEKANQQSMELGRAELEAAKWEQTIKAAVDLVKEGADAGAMPHLSPLFNGKASTLKPDLMRSQINKNNAEAAGSGGKGEQFEVKADVGPAGSGFYSFKGKGPNALDRVREHEKELLRQRGQQTKPGAAPVDETEAWRKYRGTNPQ